MHGLERSRNDAEQRFVSDMKQTTDVKPPKEIGETKSRFSDVPKEIGEDKAYPHEIPNEIRDNQQKSFLDADGNKCYTDDNGNVYRINNDLLENHTYELNGYKYETDDMGRKISAEGKLRLKEESGYNPIKGVSLSDIGKGYEEKTDDRGHLIGNRFNGAGGIGNLVPQDRKLNQVEYNTFENSLAKEVSQGKDVYIKIDLDYTGASYRPESFAVNYSINGEEYIRVFSNEPRGEMK